MGTRFNKIKNSDVIQTGNSIRYRSERAKRIYDNSLYPVFDPEGRLPSIAFSSIDITKSLKKDNTLRENDEEV